MNTTIMITQQWQVYLPEKARELIGLTTPGQAELMVRGDSILIKPKKSAVFKLAGKYKNLSLKKKINLDNIRDKIDYSSL
ncbi:MAG: hypothetical protein ABIJ43_01370 [Candidatus Beckwithbacteria bacterium]|nr:hypothetical protein [Patescibacteria group bacterium]